MQCGDIMRKIIEYEIDPGGFGKSAFKDVFWSDITATVVIPAVAADLDFPDVVIPTGGIPTGATIISARAILKWRKQVDSSTAANAINGASKGIRIKKSTGAWGTDDVMAINVPNNSMATDASSTEGGDCWIGDNDVDSEVDGVGTYNIRSEETTRGDAIVVDGASLTLYDVQMGLIVKWRP